MRNKSHEECIYGKYTLMCMESGFYVLFDVCIYIQ